MDCSCSSGLILNQYESRMLMNRAVVTQGLPAHLAKKERKPVLEELQNLWLLQLSSSFEFQGSGGRGTNPLEASQQIHRSRVRYVFDMLVEVVPVTRRSESKCQNVCAGQAVNVCSDVLPYAVCSCRCRHKS